MNKKKNIIVACIIVLLLIVLTTIFAIFNSFNSDVIEGVFIQKINVNNYSVADIKQILEEEINKVNNKQIKLKYEDKEISIKLSDLNISYNYNDAITKAYSLGRSGNIFYNNFEILKTKLFGNNINIDILIDEKIINEKIKDVYSIIPNIVEESEFYVEDSKLIITQGKSGIKVEEELLKSQIIEEINRFDNEDKEIEIPVFEKEPDEIDIEKIYKEIYREPENAYIAEDGKVYPNVNGVDFAISIEDAKNLLKENNEEYIIPLKITIASVTLQDLGKEAFPNVLGTFITRYDVTNKNRSNNISLSSEKINGTIVLPGETFSYNQIVGKRTIDAGYAEAGAYAGGKVIQEVGGGICQVSSTLYNAVLYANLEIVERSNHYFETSYVAPGRDATVSWGTVDFKFKNNRTYPILVEMNSQDGVCKATIKGIEEDEYEVIIQTKMQSIISKEINYENDYTLNSGIEIVKQEGHDGCTVDTYKILKKNNSVVSNEMISSDYYHSLEKIVIRGAKQGILNNEEEEEEDIMNGLKEDLIQNINE